MKESKIIMKITSIMLCFVILFSFCNVTQASVVDKVLNSFIENITRTLVSFGDGVVYLISKGVGEIVTIDKLVFNNVEKVSVDYWEDLKDADGTATNKTPIKNYMRNPIEKWYPVLNRVAIMVYMVVLVYIGIQIMLSSTGDKKAKYKELFTSWVVGIAILFLFPFVMKYTIILNNALVKTMQAKTANQWDGAVTEGKAGTELLEMSSWEVCKMFR